MNTDQTKEDTNQVEPGTEGQFSGELVAEDSPAWEEVAEGRYMPRRIKGSCKGRALG
jgi:hypothetical protein